MTAMIDGIAWRLVRLMEFAQEGEPETFAEWAERLTGRTMRYTTTAGLDPVEIAQGSHRRLEATPSAEEWQRIVARAEALWQEQEAARARFAAPR